MSNKIQVKRGAFASLPAPLNEGEFGFCTNTKQVFIGDGSNNFEVVMHDLFGANSILAADGADTPASLAIAEQRVLGRVTAGNIVGLTGAQLWTILTGQAGADLAMNTHKITGVTDPTAAQDVATKAYADSVASGLDLKESCDVGTTEALPACTPSGSGAGKTLTGNGVGVLTIDEVATVLNDRILVKNQATGADNGIYKVTTEGTGAVAFVLTRATDADTEVTAGMFTFIEEGAANSDEGWVLTTNDPITIDTTTLTFTQFTGVGAGANTALDNLVSVALNTALLPDAAAADDFGSAILPFKDLWFAGSSGTPATNNFKITGASTSGTRVMTFPDETGTVLTDVSTINGGSF